MKTIKSLIADYLVMWAFKLDPERFIDRSKPVTTKDSESFDKLSADEKYEYFQKRAEKFRRQREESGSYDHNQDQRSERDERLSR